MQRRAILVFCIVASLSLCDASNDTKKVENNQPKLTVVSELGTAHVPADGTAESENRTRISHVKGRPSADPSKYPEKERTQSTSGSIPPAKIISEGNSIGNSTEKPVILHKGREGVTDHNVSKSSSNETTLNIAIPQNVAANENTGNAQHIIAKSENKTDTVTSNPTIPAAKVNNTSAKTISNTTSIKPTATTATTTTTNTTTTQKPKKPKITYSTNDLPSIAKVPIPSNKFPTEKLNVDEPEQPIAQPSQEFKQEPIYHSGTDYIIPLVTLIFVAPILLGAVIIFYRRIKDYWSTRHYRRMDFLVDGMYND